MMVSSKRRLRGQQEDLEDELLVIRATLRELKKARVVEGDTLTKIRLNEQINERELRKNKLEAKLDRIEEELENPNGTGRERSNKVSFENLLKTLLRLGFDNQEEEFEKVVERQPQGAFLIRGKTRYYGQIWLAHKLSSSACVSDNYHNYYAKIDLSRHSLATDISGVYDEFVDKFNLKQDCQLEEIIKNILNLLQSQNVIICFDYTNESLEDNLMSLIDDFWHKITTDLSKSSLINSPYKLLVFFIDYQNIVSTWNISWQTKHEQVLPNDTPFNLPEIGLFTPEIIKTWMRYHQDNLPKAFYLDKEKNIAWLMQKSRGIPELTIEKICDLCQGNWSEIQGSLLQQKNE